MTKLFPKNSKKGGNCHFLGEETIYFWGNFVQKICYFFLMKNNSIVPSFEAIFKSFYFDVLGHILQQITLKNPPLQNKKWILKENVALGKLVFSLDAFNSLVPDIKC